MLGGNEIQAARDKEKAENCIATATVSEKFPTSVGYGNRTRKCKENLRVTCVGSQEDLGDPRIRPLVQEARRRQ